jgi:hypothetical protein
LYSLFFIKTEDPYQQKSKNFETRLFEILGRITLDTLYEKKRIKNFSHQFMTIQTPIESPCRVDKKYALSNFFNFDFWLKNGKKRVKMPKIRKKNSEKKCQNSNATNFYKSFTSNLII